LRDGILEDAVIAVDGILAAPSECWTMIDVPPCLKKSHMRADQ
jgi:hypothetical protein